jgi:hypothetical protein
MWSHGQSDNYGGHKRFVNENAVHFKIVIILKILKKISFNKNQILRMVY